MDRFKAFRGVEFVPSSIPVETDLPPLMFHFQNRRGFCCPPALHTAFFKKKQKPEYFDFLPFHLTHLDADAGAGAGAGVLHVPSG